MLSEPFPLGNSTRQGANLSPYLFSRYVHELLGGIISSTLMLAVTRVVDTLTH